jgi:hypothetical protein
MAVNVREDGEGFSIVTTGDPGAIREVRRRLKWLGGQELEPQDGCARFRVSTAKAHTAAMERKRRNEIALYKLMDHPLARRTLRLRKARRGVLR